MKYVVITPVRDEEKFVASTIDAVRAQTLLPVEWVIVDDGSTDQTRRIIEEQAAETPWIRVVHRPNRGFRKSGAGVVEAFYEGYGALRSNDWDFVVKLDGDLTFASDYFEGCFAHFSKQPRLGIGGGEIYHDFGGQHRLEVNPRFHVRGATKIYRRTCWEAIGGLLTAPGWDTIDEVKANMLGWHTCSFPELRLIHHRPTGSADGFLRDQIKHGTACYVCGYHPLFLAASCLRRVTKKPYIIGSAGIFYGFLKGYVSGSPRINDTQMISYVRTQQLRRLGGLETIWK
jgi:glycosyltransferase involved in cell wall biosynthesis